MIVYRCLDDIPHIDSSVITIGSFDGIHTAHKKIIDLLIAKSREYETKSVLISFTPHPRFVLGQNENDFKILTTDEEKIKYLESTELDILVLVPFTFEFSRQHPLEYIENFLYKRFAPKVIIIGYDHRFGLYRGGDINLLRKYENLFGYRILQINREDYEEMAISSSKIREYLDEGSISTANLLLGRNYSFIAEVIHGDKLGTKIGFPTANLKIERKKLIPAEGVYSGKVHIDDRIYNCMVYIGIKYFTEGELKHVLEVNIFEFKGNLYGKTIEVEIIDYIRKSIKFNNKDQIIRQLNKDKENVIKSLSEVIVNNPVEKNIAIVILNYNGLEYLEEFLETVIFNTDVPARIIIADNASTDTSVKFIRNYFPEVEIYELSDNFGFSMGYNRVIKSIDDCEYIVFLNSDVEVTEDWLSPIIEEMNNDPKIAIAQPKILSFNEKQFFEYAGASGGFIDKLAYPFCRGRIFESIEMDNGQYDNNEEIFWASGAAMVVRKKVFDQLKGFDPDFFAHQEEIDFAWRAKKCGYKVMTFSGTHVFHVGGGTLSYVNPKKTYLNFRNNLIMMLKNDSIRNILWKFPFRLLLDGIAAMKFLVEGKSTSLIAILKAHFFVYFNIIKICRKRAYYDDLVQKNKINTPNSYGIYDGYIVSDFYLKGKKKYTDLDQDKFAK